MARIIACIWFGLVAAVALGQTPRVRLDIIPDKLVWNQGEPIRGVLSIRNTGDRTIYFVEHGSGQLEILNAAGEKPSQISVKSIGCGLGQMPQLDSLPPEQSLVRSFIWNTDPLGSGGFCMPPGSYTLQYSGSISVALSADISRPRKPPLQAIVETSPVLIRVVAKENIGRRILHAAAGQDRLSIIREGGVVESYQLPSGALTGRWTDPELTQPISPASQPHHTFSRFSDDARLLVSARWTSGAATVLRARWLDSAEGRSVAWPLEPRHAFYQFATVDSTAQTATMRSGDALSQIDLRSGEITLLRTFSASITEISPDAQHVTINPPNQFQVVRVSDGAMLHPRQANLDGRSFSNFFTGCFSTRAGPQRDQVLFAPYDGSPDVFLPTAAQVPLAQSRDGRLVAIADWIPTLSPSPKDFALEVWDIPARRLFLKLSDGRQRVPFLLSSSDSSTLICAIRNEPGGWLDDDFEVYDLATGQRTSTIHTIPPDPDSALVSPRAQEASPR